jgi:adenylate cyclase
VPGWREDVQQAIAWSRAMDATTLSGSVWYTYMFAIPNGVLLTDEVVLRDSAEALAVAEQSGDDLALDLAQTARGVILVHHAGTDHQTGLDLLEKTRQRAMSERFALPPLAIANIHVAKEKRRSGDLDGAIELSSDILDDQFRSGSVIWTAFTTSVLVDALLQRGSGSDLATARAAVDRLSSAPTEPAFVLNQIWLVRLEALLARARGDDRSYRHFGDRYRKMADELGFEGHMAWAEAMD